jgi:hypothetical protein
VLMLTEGSERRARLCSMAGDVVRWRVGEELGDGVDAGLLRLLNPTARSVVKLRSREVGQGGKSFTGGDQLR